MKEGTLRIHFSPRKTFTIKKKNKLKYIIITWIVFEIKYKIQNKYSCGQVELKGFYFQEQSLFLRRKYGNPKTKWLKKRKQSAQSQNPNKRKRKRKSRPIPMSGLALPGSVSSAKHYSLARPMLLIICRSKMRSFKWVNNI